MKIYKFLSTLIYLFGLTLWEILLRQLIGFDWVKKVPYLQISFYEGMFTFRVNILLGYVVEVLEYRVKLHAQYL